MNRSKYLKLYNECFHCMPSFLKYMLDHYYLFEEYYKLKGESKASYLFSYMYNIAREFNLETLSAGQLETIFRKHLRSGFGIAYYTSLDRVLLEYKINHSLDDNDEIEDFIKSIYVYKIFFKNPDDNIDNKIKKVWKNKNIPNFKFKRLLLIFPKLKYKDFKFKTIPIYINLKINIE